MVFCPHQQHPAGSITTRELQWRRRHLDVVGAEESIDHLGNIHASALLVTDQHQRKVLRALRVGAQQLLHQDREVGLNASNGSATVVDSFVRSVITW